MRQTRCQVSLHSGNFVAIPPNMTVLRSPLGSFLWRGYMASTKCLPNMGTTAPRVASRPVGPCCLLLGNYPSFPPEHCQALSCRIFNSAFPCLLSPTGIETLYFLFSPFFLSVQSLLGVSILSFSHQALLGTFPVLPTPFPCPLSTKTSPYPLWVLSTLVHLSVSHTCQVQCSSYADCGVNPQVNFLGI